MHAAVAVLFKLFDCCEQLCISGHVISLRFYTSKTLRSEHVRLSGISEVMRCAFANFDQEIEGRFLHITSSIESLAILLSLSGGVIDPIGKLIIYWCLSQEAP